MKTKRGYLILLLIIAGGIVFYIIDPARYVFVPKCPFKLLTGLSCPGCGFQRALHAFLHGNWLEALHYNWFLICSLPYALALVLANWGLPAHLKGSWHRVLENRYVIYLYMVLFFVWWIVRNILCI